MKEEKKIKWMLFLLVVLISNCGLAATWYVRPSGGSYGTEDGTSYANAWNGFDNIDWANMGSGDTLYVCGTHLDCYLDVGQDNITIRGDYYSDPGLIDASTDIKGTTSDWSLYSTNVWRRSLSYLGFYTLYYRGIYLDGEWAIPAQYFAHNGGLNELDSNGDWTSGGSYVYIYSDSNPASKFSSIRHALKYYCILVDGCTNVLIRNIELKGCGSQHQVEEQEMSGGVFITDSSYITVQSCDIHHCNFGVRLEKNSATHHCTIQYNDIYQCQNRHPSTNYKYYGCGIEISGNDHVVRYNDISGALETYNEGSIDYGGNGICGKIYDADGDDGCHNLVIMGNDVGYIGWYGINITDLDTTTSNYNVNVRIYSNYVHDGTTTWIGDQDGISAGCQAGANDVTPLEGIVIFNNLISGYANSGVSLVNAWTNCHVFNNIISTCGTTTGGWGGMRIYNYARVYNNTIVDIIGSGIVFDAGEGSFIANNIIYLVQQRNGGSGYGIFTYSSTADTVYNNNIYATQGTAVYPASVTHDNPVVGDPKFADYLNGDFHIQSDSPCIDAARSGAPSYDYDWETRSDPDVGVDEYI